MDAGRPQDGPADDRYARRVSRNGSEAAALAVRRDLFALHGAVGSQTRTEVRLPRMAQHPGDEKPRLPEPAAVPLSQPRQRCGLRRGDQLRWLLHAARFRAGVRLPEHDRVG